MTARPGRALREQWADEALETPERAAERVLHRAACEQAHRETLEKFGTLTPENAAEAIAWQEARIKALDAVHAFERAGLGRAPFRFVGCYEDRGPSSSARGAAWSTGPARPGSRWGPAPTAGRASPSANEENAKRGLRVSLTKNSNTFHKLPNGDWGLLDWYPVAKQKALRTDAKNEIEAESDEVPLEDSPAAANS